MKRSLVIALAGCLYTTQRLGRRSSVTRDEVRSPLPGDEVVAEPMWESTRATTIDAPVDRVWPWIVQMGFPTHRAGWYTPPWLDRLTFGIRARSSDEIRPDLQRLEPGDRVLHPRARSLHAALGGAIRRARNRRRRLRERRGDAPRHQGTRRAYGAAWQRA